METNYNLTEDKNEAIIAFDTLYTSNHMRILKMIFPYVDDKFKSKLAIYIKWQELLLSIRYTNSIYTVSCPDSKIQQPKTEFIRLFPLLFPYCSEEEKKVLLKIQDILGVMENLNHIKDYLPMIQSLVSKDGNSNINLMDLMGNILSEDQLEMFRQFTEN